MLNQRPGHCQRLQTNNNFIFLLFTLLFLFISNVAADPIDDFPDAASKQAYANFLIDSEEYNTVYRLNFYDYDKSENSLNLPCSFDLSPPYNSVEKCVKDLLKDSGWLIIGDSHGRDLYNSIKMIYPKQNIAMFQMSSCAPTKYKTKGKICFEHLPEIINFINSSDSVKKVIFASRFQREPGTNQFIEEVRQGLYKKDIIIFNSGPAIEPDPISYIKQQGIKDKYLISEKATKTVQAVNEKLNSTLSSNVKIFDKYAVFCDVNGACKLLNNLHVLYRDYDSHLLKDGMKIYSEAIKRSKILE